MKLTQRNVLFFLVIFALLLGLIAILIKYPKTTVALPDRKRDEVPDVSTLNNIAVPSSAAGHSASGAGEFQPSSEPETIQVLGHDRKLTFAVINQLQLSDKEALAIQKAYEDFRRTVAEYARDQATKLPDDPTEKPYTIIGTFRTPAFPEAGETFLRDFRSSLDNILDADRASTLWQALNGDPDSFQSALYAGQNELWVEFTDPPLVEGLPPTFQMEISASWRQYGKNGELLLSTGGTYDEFVSNYGEIFQVSSFDDTDAQ